MACDHSANVADAAAQASVDEGAQVVIGGSGLEEGAGPSRRSRQESMCVFAGYGMSETGPACCVSRQIEGPHPGELTERSTSAPGPVWQRPARLWICEFVDKT